MHIIEIESLENGGHNNQKSDFLTEVPDGWAVIPEGMVLENFPFGKLNYRTINGVKTVVKWEASPIPEVKHVIKESLEQRFSKLENIITKITERFDIL